MADEIQDWAKERVGKLMCGEAGLLSGDSRFEALRNAFARYIQHHEKPPVDLLLVEARQLAARQYQSEDDGIVRHYMRTDGSIMSGTGSDIAEMYLDGRCDDRLPITLAALRRGIEIGKDQPHAD